MNIFKKALIVALSIGLISIPSAAKEVEVVEAATSTNEVELFLKPNSNWKQSNARFSIYTWGGSSGEKWVSMTDKNKDGVYEGVLPVGYENIIFCRMNPGATANSWNNKWNQTGDLKFDGKKNYFSVPNGAWDGSTTGWANDTYKTYSIKYIYNDGITLDNKVDNVLAKGISCSVTLEQPNEVKGKTFLGWSTNNDSIAEYEGKTANITYTGTGDALELYGVWADAKVYYPVTLSVGTYSVTHNFEENTPISDVFKYFDSNIKEKKLNVISWEEYPEIVSSELNIKAENYYTEIDELKAELSFTYSYSSTLVIFQVKLDKGLPKCIGDNGKDSEEVEMKWCRDLNDEKKEFFANIPVKYNTIRFTWENPENSTQKGEFTTERDFYENAIWYNNQTSYGKWHYNEVSKDGFSAPQNDFKVTKVSNTSLRLGTTLIPVDGFGGVTSYGIRITKGTEIAEDNYYGPTWTFDSLAKFDKNGKETADGTFIKFSSVIKNIPLENIKDSFTATAYVVIGNEKYDICTNGPRTMSVYEAAKTYVDENKVDGINKEACQYIVDTYAK